MKHSGDTVEGSVRRIEHDLGLQDGFLESLRKEDDWSFVIKTHALLEAAIGHILCKTLKRDELSEVFSFLELSDKRKGKIAFISALNLLQKPDRRLISSLSELRNMLVHDVKNTQFHLQEHVDGLDPEAFKTFTKSFNSFSSGEKVIFEGKESTPEQMFKRDAKTAVWWSAMVTLAIIYQVREIDRLKNKAEKLEAAASTLASGR